MRPVQAGCACFPFAGTGEARRKSDVSLARWAAQAAYTGLLENGIRIYEYLPRMLVVLVVLVVLLVPFFFVTIGSLAEWDVLADTGMPALVTGLLSIAILGKVTGGLIGAWRAGTPGLPLLVGVSMVPRGEVALIIAGLGFAQHHISHHVLVALVLMAIGAALLAPLVMAHLAHLAHLL